MCDFPVPGLPMSKCVFASGDEPQRVELEAARARQLWIERPVELRQRQLFLKTRLLVTALDQARLTTIQFVLQNQKKVSKNGWLAPWACTTRVWSVSRTPDRRSRCKQRSISGIVIVMWFGSPVGFEKRSECSWRQSWPGLRRRRERGLQ